LMGGGFFCRASTSRRGQIIASMDVAAALRWNWKAMRLVRRASRSTSDDSHVVNNTRSFSKYFRHLGSTDDSRANSQFGLQGTSPPYTNWGYAWRWKAVKDYEFVRSSPTRMTRAGVAARAGFDGSSTEGLLPRVQPPPNKPRATSVAGSRATSQHAQRFALPDQGCWLEISQDIEACGSPKGGESERAVFAAKVKS